MLPVLCFLFFALICSVEAYFSHKFLSCHHLRPRSVMEANLFGGLFGGNKVPELSAPKAKPLDPAKKVTLEKISNTQNRNWVEEQKKAEARLPQKEMADKQVVSYNFGKADQFPNLYKGWIKAQGDQIATQMIKAARSALAAKEKYVEVLFDPVPNLDEVAFGTEWNQKLRMEVSANLKVPDWATNRGGPATLEWSNLYWANRLIEGLGAKKVVMISLSGEGTRGQALPTFSNGAKLLTLQEARKPDALKLGEVGLLILLSPCQDTHYLSAQNLADKLNVPCVALNSPYSFRYDVGKQSSWHDLSYTDRRN